MRELRDSNGSEEVMLCSGEGSMIEHPVKLEAELEFLMGEMERVTGLQKEVIRRIGRGGAGEEEDTKEEDEDESFERDEETALLRSAEEGSNVAPAVRAEILEEFDGLIESNEFVDAELLQAVLERLWNVTCEEERERLVSQLRRNGDGDTINDETTFHQEEKDQNTTLEGLAEDCAQDIANVENAISFLGRRIKGVCERELPFTVFNGQTLTRFEELMKEAIKSFKLNLLADRVFFDAVHSIVFRYERKPVQEHVDALIAELSDMLYDEMLFANLHLKQNSQFEASTSNLRLQARALEVRLAQMQAAQKQQQEALMKERQARLAGAARQRGGGDGGGNASLFNMSQQEDLSFGGALDPASIIWENEVVMESPGGDFAFSPQPGSPPSPSALHVYDQLMIASTPALKKEFDFM